MLLVLTAAVVAVSHVLLFTAMLVNLSYQLKTLPLSNLYFTSPLPSLLPQAQLDTQAQSLTGCIRWISMDLEFEFLIMQVVVFALGPGTQQQHLYMLISGFTAVCQEHVAAGTPLLEPTPRASVPEAKQSMAPRAAFFAEKEL